MGLGLRILGRMWWGISSSGGDWLGVSGARGGPRVGWGGGLASGVSWLGGLWVGWGGELACGLGWLGGLSRAGWDRAKALA